MGITSTPNFLWVCGVGEGIASSSEGVHWEIKHPKKEDGSLLLGIRFASERFGYAYGTGGLLLSTEDAGATWVRHQLGDESILLASLASTGHGLVRTSRMIALIDETDTLRPIQGQPDVVARFKYAPSLAALTEDKMAVLLSDGQYGEGGFLATVDGGRNWSFYDPPSSGIRSFLEVDGRYWASGHEVVGKDKPGGGYGVPLAMSSTDGSRWVHTEQDVQPCHWEVCRLCTRAGCLASGELLIDFFHGKTTFATIPKGPLTSRWASISGLICSIEQRLACAPLSPAIDVLAQPETSAPSERPLPPLGTKRPDGLLQCLSCAVEQIYVDKKAQGRMKVHVAFVVRPDGTVENVKIEGPVPTAIQEKIRAAVMEWLFEPPRRDGKPIQISTQSDVGIEVVRPR